jgi:hypothetical protein
MVFNNPKFQAKMPRKSIGSEELAFAHLRKVIFRLSCALTPNPSLKRSANGRPPGPVWRYALHFRQPGPGVLPLAPA